MPLLARGEVDPAALEEYLSFMTVAAPRTLLATSSSFRRYEMRIDRSGTPVTRTYWDPIGNRDRFDVDDVDWESGLRYRLERSVRRRMLSDVPVGVFLSGVWLLDGRGPV